MSKEIGNELDVEKGIFVPYTVTGDMVGAWQGLAKNITHATDSDSAGAAQKPT